MNSQVAEALRKLYLEKRTGVLLGEGEETKRSIMVRAGSLVGARSSLMDDRLGEVMIRRGKISRRQSEEAAKHIKSGLKLGEILVKLGYIEASDIDEMVRVQLVDIVCGLLLWPPARMVFTDMESVDAIVGQPPVSVADVIMEATRRSAQVAPRLKALLALEKPLQLAQDPAFRSQEVQLTPEEGYIASRIDGHETAKSIVNVSPLSETETARTLLGLMEAGNVDDAQVSAKKVIEHLFEHYQEQDHWTVLGVKRGASLEKIDAAFRDKTKLYHPDNYHHIQDREFQEKLTHVFCRLNDAHQTLTGKEQAKGYDELTKKEQQYEKQNKEWSAPPKETPRERKPIKGEKSAPPSSARRERREDFFRASQERIPEVRLLDDDPVLPTGDRDHRRSTRVLPLAGNGSKRESQVAPGRGAKPQDRDQVGPVEAGVFGGTREGLPGCWYDPTSGEDVRASARPRSELPDSRLAQIVSSSRRGQPQTPGEGTDGFFFLAHSPFS